MVKTASGLVEFAKRYVGNPYWYGTFVIPCTQNLLNSKKRQYPTHYTAGRMARYNDDIAKRKTCSDCVGLIKGYGWSDANGVVKYATNGVPDQSADGMYAAAKKKGVISTMPDIPGLAVRYPGHIGVYIGKGEVVEARGFNFGIVTTKLAGRNWTHWLEVPWINYTAKAVTDTSAAPEPAITVPVTTEPAAVEPAAVEPAAVESVVVEPTAATSPAQKPKMVIISGGAVNIRGVPDLAGKVKGVAKNGDWFEYMGQTSSDGWLSIKFNNELSWVSGKFARLAG